MHYFLKTPGTCPFDTNSLKFNLLNLDRVTNDLNLPVKTQYFLILLQFIFEFLIKILNITFCLIEDFKKIFFFKILKFFE